MTTRILLVEDDRPLAKAMASALERRLMVVDRVRRIDEARAALADAVPYDVVLLDRRLPDGDGATLLAALRGKPASPRVIMVTARDDLTDRVEGLESGADDYIVKPFEMEELAARIKAVMRRTAPERQTDKTFGALRLDAQALRFSVDGTPFDLPRRELLALATLMSAQGRGVLREKLMADVYGLDADIQPNALEGHLSRLRLKLRQLQAGVTIKTIRGVGYQLASDPHDETTLP